MTPELQDSLINTASTGDVNAMRTLLMAGEESPSEEVVQDLLTAAARNSHLEVVNLLLNQYPSIPLDEEIVRAAVNTGSIPIFKLLLTRDPSIVKMQFDRRGTPLIVACMGRQKIEFLRFLLEAGADPNQDPDAASFPITLVAALYQDPAAIDLLLQHGARLENSGALAAAAHLGNDHMIQRLLDRGASVGSDAPTMGNNTSPLHVAVKAGHVGVIKILLRHGAEPSATDDSGVTAIEVAQQMSLKGKDMSEMIEILGGEQ